MYPECPNLTGFKKPARFITTKFLQICLSASRQPDPRRQ